MLLVFDLWLYVIWLKLCYLAKNATYCIDFNILIRILNTLVSAKMTQGQRKWHAVYIYIYICVCVCLSAFFLEKGVFFSAIIREKGVFFKLWYKRAGELNICSHCYSVPYMKIPAINQVILLSTGRDICCSSDCIKSLGEEEKLAAKSQILAWPADRDAMHPTLMQGVMVDHEIRYAMRGKTVGATEHKQILCISSGRWV